MRPNFHTLTLILLVGAFVLAGCAAPAASAPAPSKVSVQLGWIYEFSTAEFYAAEKNGHFAAQNLSVNLRQGGFIDGKYVDAISDLLAGQADFGITSDQVLLQARADGKPLVAVAAILQRNPMAIISLPKSNIRKPQDLVGKTVAVADGGARLLYNALLSSQGIDPSKVNTVVRKTYGIDTLMNGQVDAILGWIINEGVQVKQAGFEPNFVLLSDYGIETYQNILVTTEKMINEQPDVVQRVVSAMIQGMQDMIGNPDQALNYVVAYGKDLKKDDQAIHLNAMLPLLNPSGTKLGMMDDKTWQSTYQIMVDQKALSNPIDPTKAYTLTFLKQIYK